MMVPLHASNWPRTLLTRCLMVNESTECVGSIFQVDGARTEAAAGDDCAETALRAKETPGAAIETPGAAIETPAARTRMIESLRMIWGTVVATLTTWESG